MNSRRVLPVGDPPTGQIAFVTNDLERAARRWLELGIGPWDVRTFDEGLMREMEYQRAPGRFSAAIALCSIGSMTYELIEPLTGPSVWEDFLKTRGEGVHHLGYYVDDIIEATAAMASRGYAVAQSAVGFGLDGDGAFAYFDTVDDLGCYMEAIVGPRGLAPPQRRIG